MNRLRIVVMSLVLLFAMSCGNRTGESYEARLRGNVVLVQMEEYHPAFRNTMKGWREFFAPGIDPKEAGDPNVDIAQFADLQNDTTLKYTLE